MKTHEVDRLALLIHIIANTLTGQSFMVVQILRNHNQLDASLAHAVFALLNRVQEREGKGCR